MTIRLIAKPREEPERFGWRPRGMPTSAMPLWLGVWMPNIVCFFAGLFFIRQASRQGISLF